MMWIYWLLLETQKVNGIDWLERCQSKLRQESGQVDVMIGTGKDGHTFPGATRRFGMVQLSPSSGVRNSWQYCSGYHYDGNEFAGMTHTALSGTGLGDFGDLLLKPICQRGNIQKLRHEDECAVPGLYTLRLDCGRIEATATTRVGLTRVVCKECVIRIDSSWGQNSKTFDSRIKVLQKEENSLVYFNGERSSGGFGRRRDSHGKLHFRAQRHIFFWCFALGVARTVRISPKIIELYNVENVNLEVRCGLSSTSIKNAAANLKAEAPRHFSFDSIAEAALADWHSVLREDFGLDLDDNMLGASVLRTALYHTLLVPNTLSDLDSSAPSAFAPSIGKQQFSSWTVSTLSTWDIFRAQFPWLTLFAPDAARATADSMIRYATKSHYLPKWLLAESETDVMIGYHGVAMLSDALIKGLVSAKQAAIHVLLETTSSKLEAAVHFHTMHKRMPSHDRTEAVSTGLEIAVDDTCASRAMKVMGLYRHADRLRQRGLLYHAYFDNSSGYFRGDQVETEFDPYEFHYANRKSAHDFTEGSAAQYLFTPALVDADGLIRLLGGPDTTKKRLDALFDPSLLRNQNGARDVTGCLGQCCLGNEVVHHIPYLYNYIDRPDLTQRRLNEILLTSKLFGSGPNGLCGNDDCGQLSAFLLLSALGLYPADPCSSIWQIGRPLVRAANLTLRSSENAARTLRIIAHDQALHHPYVHSVRLDGRRLSRSFVYHNELLAGPLLEFFMAPNPRRKSKSRRRDSSHHSATHGSLHSR